MNGDGIVIFQSRQVRPKYTVLSWSAIGFVEYSDQMFSI